MKQSEKQLHSQVCQYLKIAYPKIIFNTDSSGIKLTIGQATQLKKLRSGNGFPDIMIFEPVGAFNGLFLELKAEGTKIFKRDGTLVNEHLNEQYEMICKLREKDYAAYFAVGFDQAIKIIDSYLK